MSVQTSAGILPETDAELVRRGDAILAELARLALEVRRQVYELPLPVEDPQALMQHIQHHAATMVELAQALDRFGAWSNAYRRTVIEPTAQLGAGAGGQLA